MKFLNDFLVCNIPQLNPLPNFQCILGHVVVMTEGRISGNCNFPMRRSASSVNVGCSAVGRSRFCHDAQITLCRYRLNNILGIKGKTSSEWKQLNTVNNAAWWDKCPVFPFLPLLPEQLPRFWGKTTSRFMNLSGLGGGASESTPSGGQKNPRRRIGRITDWLFSFCKSV